MIEYDGLLVVLPSGPTKRIFFCTLLHRRGKQNQFPKCSGRNKLGRWANSKPTSLNDVPHNRLEVLISTEAVSHFQHSL
jgi:hypothetical protein